VGMAVGMHPQAISGQLGLKSAGVIQICPIEKRLIFIKYFLRLSAYHQEMQGDSTPCVSRPH
jgi:hypothetical protein